jgi:PAS domain S-box-containing protein
VTLDIREMLKQHGRRAIRSRLLLPMVGVLLTSVIGLMIWGTHVSSVARERETLLRMEKDVHGVAATLGYFFYERANDLRAAADNRQVLTYFENKALGMSEEYGLLATRQAIEENFGKLIEDRRVGGGPIYSGLALVDIQGTVIAESVVGIANATGETPWTAFIPQGENPSYHLAVDLNATPPNVVLCHPVSLHEQLAGYVLARIPLEPVLPFLTGTLERGARFSSITTDRDIVANPSKELSPDLLKQIEEHWGDQRLTLKRLAIRRGGSDALDQFVVWVPVEGTPLRMLTLAETRELLSTVSPWLITGATALLCMLTLAALTLAWRANTAQLVLTARLEEKTMSEEATSQKAREQKVLLDSLPGYAFFKDAGGRYITGNAAFCDLVGVTHEELVGRTDHEVFPASYADGFVAADASILSGKTDRIEVEEQVIDGGSTRDLSTRKVAIKNTKGETLGLIGLGYDITEKKRFERELQAANAEMELRVAQRTSQLAEANARLGTEVVERKHAHRDISLVLSAIPAVLVAVDRQGRVSKWNKAAVVAFGTSEEQSLGQEFTALPLTWEWDRVLDGLAECSAEQQPVKINNLWYERADGKEGFLILGMSPILGEQSELEGVLILGSEVTDFKMLESQLAQAQKLESIGQLAAGIAHEINTPAQFVGDTVTFLRDANADLMRVLDIVAEVHGPVGQGEACTENTVARARAALEEADYPFLREEMPRSFARAMDGVERVSAIVRAMRYFSHPGESEKKAVDINQAIENTVTVSRNEWKYVATMETDLDPQLAEVVCLPGEMNQVLLNLVVNAAHAVGDVIRGTGKFGVIRVKTVMEEGQAHISISDSGTGIPEVVQSRIFDPFFTTKDVGKGTGQGLTLAYDIVVNKHGGTISFETREGLGTTFHIRLPLGG